VSLSFYAEISTIYAAVYTYTEITLNLKVVRGHAELQRFGGVDFKFERRL
jgi:hypothetical protein